MTNLDNTIGIDDECASNVFFSKNYNVEMCMPNIVKMLKHRIKTSTQNKDRVTGVVKDLVENTAKMVIDFRKNMAGMDK